MHTPTSRCSKKRGVTATAAGLIAFLVLMIVPGSAHAEEGGASGDPGTGSAGGRWPPSSIAWPPVPPTATTDGIGDGEALESSGRGPIVLADSSPLHRGGGASTSQAPAPIVVTQEGS